MAKQRKNNAYLILILLIFLVVAIIGGLTAALFSMTPSIQDSETIPTPELKTNIVEHITPVSETYIEVAIEKVEKAREERQATGPTVVPAVCDGYGPQIKQRDAYEHPVTYRAQIKPNHVQFTIYADQELNSKGSK